MLGKRGGPGPDADLLTCEDCEFFNNDPREIENLFQGIRILSSAYSSTRGNAGLCAVHDLFMNPGAPCAHFRRSPRSPVESEGP